MYRPEGLKNPYSKGTNPKYHIGATCPHCAFEAGADAMLEGLKKNAYILGDIARNTQSTSAKWYDSVTNLQKGNWYFIPEEE